MCKVLIFYRRQDNIALKMEIKEVNNNFFLLLYQRALFTDTRQKLIKPKKCGVAFILLSFSVEKHTKWKYSKEETQKEVFDKRQVCVCIKIRTNKDEMQKKNILFNVFHLKSVNMDEHLTHSPFECS